MSLIGGVAVLSLTCLSLAHFYGPDRILQLGLWADRAVTKQTQSTLYSLPVCSVDADPQRPAKDWLSIWLPMSLMKPHSRGAHGLTKAIVCS